MVEAINIKNNNIKNPFGDFQTNSNRYYFATTKLPNTADSYQSEKTKEEKKTKKLGKKIALSTLGVGLSILFLMRGLPKNTYKTLEKWAQKLESKIYNQRKSGNMGKLEEFYTFTLNKMLFFVEKTKSINNFVSIKDITFEKMMSKNKYTKKIHTRITNIYESIGKRTVRKSFEKAKEKMYKAFQIAEDYDGQILLRTDNGKAVIEGKTVKDWLDEIETLKTSIRRTWNEHSGKPARTRRFEQMKNDVQNLSDEVWESTGAHFTNFKNRQLYETFIAEEKLAGKKLKMMNESKEVRYTISRDIDDIYNSTMDLISNITSFVKSKDTSSRELIKNLRFKLGEWQKLDGPNEAANRIKLNDEIKDLLNKLTTNINRSSKTFDYDEATIKQLNTSLEGINQIMGKDGKGDLQKIFTIYKKLLPPEEYKQLKNLLKENFKYMDDAIDKETDSFYDMLRDLQLGSAPTDILSILAAVGAVGVGLTKADNKDQQNSVLLKAGIPALSAITTSLYFSASLVSGGKAMLYGGLSGIVVNYIGSKLDKYRKEHFEIKEPAVKAQNQ